MPRLTVSIKLSSRDKIDGVIDKCKAFRVEELPEKGTCLQLSRQMKTETVTLKFVQELVMMTQILAFNKFMILGSRVEALRQ